jgi:hypothetical protein
MIDKQRGGTKTGKRGAFECYNKPTVKYRIFIAKPVRKGPIPVNEAEISRYITETCEGVDVVADSGNSFFFDNPDRNVPPDHRFPLRQSIICEAWHSSSLSGEHIQCVEKREASW